MAKIISITGDLGSGKSTVSDILCKRLNYEYVYTGKIQREIARKHNMTTLELNKYAETHPEIDEEIDSTFKSLNESADLIVDSRLAWFFIPESFKVFLKTDLAVSASRISGDSRRENEKYSSTEDAVNKIVARKASENKRYMELYGADCSDLSNFDLIVDTSFVAPERVADAIFTEYNSWLASGGRSKPSANIAGRGRGGRRPVIGVIPLWDDAKDSVWMLPGYMRGLEDAGAVPVILPLTVSADVLKQAAGLCDGFLFTGGQDVNPALYGEAKHDCCGEICDVRDQMETYIFREFVLNQNKPALGICRGIQFINAALGGNLYQDLPTEFSGALNHQGKGLPYDAPAHAVRIMPDSPLRGLIGKERVEVNSFHHQGVNRVAEGLSVMAVADDGLAEAVYMPGCAYVWAVQWHPEFYLNDETSRKIFASFVESAGAGRPEA